MNAQTQQFARVDRDTAWQAALDEREWEARRIRDARHDEWAPIERVSPVRQSNELLTAILLKDGPLTAAEAAYVAVCEARAA